MDGMGMRGPVPKPTALKILEGNPGKQKLNKAEPKPPVPPNLPKPPARLLKEAKEEWKRLVPALHSMGVLTQIDLSAFAEVCQNYGYYLITDKKILALGEQGVYAMQKTATGYIQQHPLLSLRRQYYEQWRKGLADFGLTPATRARLDVGDQGPHDGANSDPMEQLLSNYWRE
jgi:P27 family predicted phage terminase small subunit